MVVELVTDLNRLRQCSAPVRVFNADLAELARQMGEFAGWSRAYGLAAPQIGHPIRLIVVFQESGFPMPLVNPAIKSRDGVISSTEGCLSLPLIITVQRARSIEVAYYDLTGKSHYSRFDAPLSCVIQHEIDHLNGLLLDSAGNCGIVGV
jgi:peptide deformylase